MHGLLKSSEAWVNSYLYFGSTSRRVIATINEKKAVMMWANDPIFITLLIIEIVEK